MAKVEEGGDANQYTVVTDDSQDWMAAVQINGELTLATQRELMAAIAAACAPYTVKLTSQRSDK